MKKRILILLLIALYSSICTSIFAAAPKEQKMWISVSSADIKASTGAFAKTVATLEYGTQVTQTKTEGSKSFITCGNISGWVPTSSLSKRKIVGKGANFSADADELALAGKGFNAEVEKQYKKSGKADYDAVNKVETIAVTDEELLQFITEGELKGAE